MADFSQLKLNAEKERYESHYHQEVEPNHQNISNMYENKELLQKLNKIIVMLENSKISYKNLF